MKESDGVAGRVHRGGELWGAWRGSSCRRRLRLREAQGPSPMRIVGCEALCSARQLGRNCGIRRGGRSTTRAGGRTRSIRFWSVCGGNLVMSGRTTTSAWSMRPSSSRRRRRPITRRSASAWDCAHFREENVSKNNAGGSTTDSRVRPYERKLAKRDLRDAKLQWCRDPRRRYRSRLCPAQRVSASRRPAS